MKKLLFLVCLIMFANVWADSDGDHDEARQLRLRGDILSLQEILGKAEAAGLTTILEVELEQEHDGWHYDIEGLSRDNRLIEMTIDASTGEILETEYKKRRHWSHD